MPAGLECTGWKEEVRSCWLGGVGKASWRGVVREAGGSQPGGGGVSGLGNSMFKARGRSLAVPGMTQAGAGSGQGQGAGACGECQGGAGLACWPAASGSLELAAPGYAGKRDQCVSGGSQAVRSQAQNERCWSQGLPETAGMAAGPGARG